jgi:hypothetical protein
MTDDTITICETLRWPEIGDGGPDPFEALNGQYLRPLRMRLHRDGHTSKLRRSGNSCTLEVTAPAAVALSVAERLRELQKRYDDMFQIENESKQRTLDMFMSKMKQARAQHERDAAEFLLEGLRAAQEPGYRSIFDDKDKP